MTLALHSLPYWERGLKGLSASNIVRLKASWEKDYEEWTKRDLSDKKYVYFWVDGVYFNVRLEDERSCILIIIAAEKDGNKELLAVSDGYRESKIAWKDRRRRSGILGSSLL